MHQQPDLAAMLAGLQSTGMSRTEISNATGLSRQTIWRFASGMGREPTADAFLRVQQLVHKVMAVQRK
jgi:transcriptional regulator with XRE-family HTH domain